MNLAYPSCDVRIDFLAANLKQNLHCREMDSRHGTRAVRAKDSFVYDLLTEFKRGRDAFLIAGKHYQLHQKSFIG